MAKVTYKYGVDKLKANLDDLIVYYSPKRHQNLARIWVMPEATEQNAVFGNVHRNLSRLWKSADVAFKKDFRIYAEFLGGQTNSCIPSYAVFIGMLYAYKKMVPAVDLRTLSKTEITDNDLPVKSIRTAINAGLLVPVAEEGIGANVI